ncbi:MAG: hypothetical protein WC595_01910 [Candidatus Nanoarchaeia archaeon]
MKRRVFLGLIGGVLSGKAFAAPAGKTEVAKILERDPGNKVKVEGSLRVLFRSDEYQRFAKGMLERVVKDGEDKNDIELRVYWDEEIFVRYLLSELPEGYLKFGLLEAGCKKGKPWKELCADLKQLSYSISTLNERKVVSNFSKAVLGEQGFRDLLKRMYNIQSCLLNLAERYNLECKQEGKAVS